MDWNDNEPDKMSLAQLFAQSCRLATWRLRVHIEKIGIHSSQGRVLAHLHRQDNIPQWKIARAMNASPAAITNILQRMERDGWITRTRDPADQRMVRIRLSEKARKLEQEIKNTFMEIEEEISSIYTPEERATLRVLLLKLHDKFSKSEGDQAVKPDRPNDRRKET